MSSFLRNLLALICNLGVKIADLEAGHAKLLQPGVFSEGMGAELGARIGEALEAAGIVVRRRVLIDDRHASNVSGIRLGLGRVNLLGQIASRGFYPDIVTHESDLRGRALELAHQVREEFEGVECEDYHDGRWGRPNCEVKYKSRFRMFWKGGPSATAIDARYTLDKLSSTLCQPADVAIVVLPAQIHYGQEKMLLAINAAGGDPDRVIHVFFKDDGSVSFNGTWYDT